MSSQLSGLQAKSAFGAGHTVSLLGGPFSQNWPICFLLSVTWLFFVKGLERPTLHLPVDWLPHMAD